MRWHTKHLTYEDKLANNLRQAISSVNFREIHRILNIRDDRGSLRVDLFRDTLYEDAPPAPFLHAINEAIEHAEDGETRREREDIVKILLAEYSRLAGAPLHYFRKMSQSIVSALLEVERPGHNQDVMRWRLFEQVLNCRDRWGGSCLDFKSVKVNWGTHSYPLFWVVAFQEDRRCLEMLLDTRDRRNNYLLDTNELYDGQTLLDALWEREDTSQEVLDIIFLNHGLHASELRLRPEVQRRRINERYGAAQLRQAGRLREQEAAYQAEQAARFEEELRMQEVHAEVFQDPMAEGAGAARAGGADDAVRDAEREALVAEFAGSAQNTHDSEVTQSVSASVRNLKRRYPRIAIEETIQAVLRFLEGLGGGPNKRTALQCVERISSISIPHQASGGTTLRHVLALVWHGIEDRHALPEGVTTPLTDKDIADRKHQLMLQLHEAQTEDPSGGPLCFMGTFNKIVETLNRMHPDVLIIEGAANIVSALGDRAKILLRDFLREKPVADQKLILSGWDELDDNPSLAEQAANAFREEAIKKIQAELAKEYSSLLTPQLQEEVFDGLEYLPRPVMHEERDVSSEAAVASPDVLSDVPPPIQEQPDPFPQGGSAARRKASVPRGVAPAEESFASVRRGGPPNRGNVSNRQDAARARIENQPQPSVLETSIRQVIRSADEKLKTRRADILATLNDAAPEAFSGAAEDVYNNLVTAHQKNGALGLFGTWKAERDLIERLDATLNNRAPTCKATDTAMVFRFLFELLYQVFQKIVDTVLPSQGAQVSLQQTR